MLRKVRLTLAIVFFACITLLFLDFTGTVHAWLSWMATIQFLPAVLALHLAVVAAWIVIALIFGRIYCSVICPLGVMQDVVSWISGRRNKGRKRMRFASQKRTEICDARGACRGIGGRCRFAGSPAGSIQFLRKNRPEPLPTYLSAGQQCPGLSCRAHGQLCFL